MFYRGLLILLVRSIASNSLSKTCMHDIVFTVASAFSSNVLAILNVCDSIIETVGTYGQIDDAKLRNQSSALLGGLRVMEVTAINYRFWECR